MLLSDDGDESSECAVRNAKFGFHELGAQKGMVPQDQFFGRNSDD